MHGYVACIQETIHKYIHSYPCIYCNSCIPPNSACIFVHTSHADMSCIPEWRQASWPHAYIHGCNACLHAYTHLYSDAHTHSYLCIPKQFPPNFIHTMLTYYLPCPPSPLHHDQMHTSMDAIHTSTTVLSCIHASIFLCTHSFILMYTHTVSNFPPNFIHTMLTYSLPCPQSPPRLCIVQVAQLLSSWLVSSSSICDACILSSLAQSIPHLFT